MINLFKNLIKKKKKTLEIVKSLIEKRKLRKYNVKIYFTNDKPFLCGFKEHIIRISEKDLNKIKNSEYFNQLKKYQDIIELENLGSIEKLTNFKNYLVLNFKYGEVNFNFATEYIKSIEFEIDEFGEEIEIYEYYFKYI